MTLAELLQALINASPRGTLNPYDPAPDPNGYLTPLTVAANKFGPAGALTTIAGVAPTQVGDAVTATGTAGFTVPGGTNPLTVAVTLTAKVDPHDTTKARFSLALAGPASGWAVGTTFPNLPRMQRLHDGLLPWSDSYLATLTIGAPTFTATSDAPGTAPAVGFTGSLPVAANAALTGYAGWLGAGPLTLGGTIVLPQTAGAWPVIDWRASVSGPVFGIGTLTARDLSLVLRTQVGLDPLQFGTEAQSLLSVTVTIGLGGTQAQLSAPLLQGDDTWPLYLRFEATKEPALTGGLATISGLFGGLAPGQFPVPDSLPIVSDFFIASIGVGFAPPTKDHPRGGMRFVEITLGSHKEWQPPVPFVTIRGVGMRWVLMFGADAYAPSLTSAIIAGSVYGDVVVGGRPFGATERFAGLRDVVELADPGPTSDTFTIRVNALIPQFVVTGELADDSTIPLDSALNYFFGGAGPDGPFKQLAITAFSFEGAPREQTYRAEAAVTTSVTVSLGASVSIELQQLAFWIDVTQGAVAGGLSAMLQLQGAAPPGRDDPIFLLAADYDRDTTSAGWTFSGRLQDGMAVDLTGLAKNFLGLPAAPDWVPRLEIDRLAATFHTGDQTYALAGTARARWPAPILGIAGGVAVEASADIEGQRNASGAIVPVGTLAGHFTISKVELGLATNIGAPQRTFTFTARFDRLLLTVTTGRRTSKGASAPHQVFFARLGGITLGDILEYLVNLAAPTVGYTLDPPWDLLNRVELSRFQLMLDPTENLVEITYDIGASLVVMSIDRIGVRYARPGGRPTVELILEGDFLGKPYAGDDALAWNVIDDPPPAVPGQGTSLVDIRYLGLGQRVAFANDVFNRIDTVRSFLNELAAQMGRVEDTSGNPLTQNPGMRFAPDSDWLIGLDLTLMDTVAVGFLFNDPRLYGLSIALSGEKAGSFAGLDFEILYKKISNDVGMFRIELKLPDKFRSFEMGAVSVTLGTIVVEIYTNGNFMIDLGFPYDRDYGRAFTVQMFPFIGRGGLYFGLLDGTTSRRTPRIVNGTFAPVIELGIGLAVGVGKDVRFGPLSGGAYVQVEAAFQGVLAWFNPSDAGAPSPMYYWAQAVVAIHGRIYGEVDFVLVKASANVEVYAEASVVLEAFKAMLIRLAARVEVSASIKILFVRIHFSFGASIDLSFTVGSDATAPWILASGGSGAGNVGSARNGDVVHADHPQPLRRSVARRNALLLRSHQLRRVARLALDGAAHRAALRRVLTGAPDYQLSWNPALQVFSSTRQVPITIVAAGTLGNLPVAWTGSAPPLPSAPTYRLAFIASAANGQSDDSERRTTAASAQAAEVGDLPTDTMMEALLLWSLAAVTGSTTGNVTAAEMRLLADQMTWPETTAAFALGALSTFFSNNVLLRVSGPPTSGPMPDGYGAGVIPMPPFLTWSSTQAPTLGASPSVGPLYEWGANAFFTQFQAPRGVGTPPPVDTPPTGYETVAQFVFRDWCLMLARTAVRGAADAMDAFPVAVPTPTSLTAIANAMPTVSQPYLVRAGDTVASVALALGVTDDELTFHNAGLATSLATAAPGDMLTVTLGVSPGEVAADNATLGLVGGVEITLGTVPYQVQALDTLAGIAARFGLSGAQDLFSTTTLAADARLLQVDAVFAIPAVAYANPHALPLLLAAAVFYVRITNDIHVPGADWYAQAVFQLNGDAGRPLARWTGVDLPVGAALQVPSALDALTDPLTYTTLPGDTLPRLGAALALAQNFATGGPAAWAGYLAAVRQANPRWTSGQIVLPALPITGLPGVVVASGETAAMLATRLILFDGNVPGFLAWIGTQPILAPLAMVAVPGVSFTTSTSATTPDTFGGLALRFGLSVTAFGSIAAVATSTALIPSGANATVTVSHPPVVTIASLVTAVMAGTAPANAAGMTARQLLSGQYLPAPHPTQVPGQVDATGPLTPLLDLTGQQVNGPAPDQTKPADVGFSATVGVADGCTWIELVTSTTSGADESLDALRARLPRLVELNPAIAAPGRLRGGLLLHAELTNTLILEFTNAQLAGMYPSAGLALAPTIGPKPLPVAGKVPRTYGLDHRVQLQVPAPLAFNPASGPLVGTWTVWPFSDAFRQRAREATATSYELAQRETHDDRPQASDLVTTATWATMLSFGVRRMGDRQGVYELVGVDTSGRQTLLQLWKRLAAQSGAVACLLYAPAPSSGNTLGLAMTQPVGASTFIVKSNMGTETHSGVHAPDDEPAGYASPANEYFASFQELPAFCTLLWEASVVGGTGYVFGFRDTAGNGLPDSAFDQSGLATLSLLVIDGAQQAAAPAGRPLLATNNCALVAPGLDATSSTMFALAADDSDEVDMPTFSPGTVGFTVTLPEPPANASATASDLLAAQFGLLSYSLAAVPHTPYTPPGQPALPMSPQKSDGGEMSLARRHNHARRVRAGVAEAPAAATTSYWRFEQAFPVARFGPASPAPAVTGYHPSVVAALPAPAGDPYRGVGAAASTVPAQVQLAPADVFGNIAAPTTGGTVDFTVGYTDPIVGVGNWPATTTGYAVSATASAVSLTVTVMSQPAALAPAFGQSVDTLVASARLQADKYAEAYYQLAQAQVVPELLTTLSTQAGLPVPLPVDRPELAWRYAAAGYLYATAAAGAQAVTVDNGIASTLGAIASSYGIDAETLGAANGATAVVDALGAVTLTVPVGMAVPDGDSANDIVAAEAARGARWPVPASGAALMQMPENAGVLLIRPKSVIAFPAATFSVPAAGASGTPSLGALAAAMHTTAVLLAGDNASGHEPALADKFVFTLDHDSVTVDAVHGPSTLSDVVTKFATQYGVQCSVADLAAANGDTPGMFAARTTLSTAHLVAGDDQTLEDIVATPFTYPLSTPLTLGMLATANAGVANLYDAGAVAALGTLSVAIAHDDPRVFTDLALAYGCTTGAILVANGAVAVPAGSTLLLPATVAPPSASTTVPFACAATDTLAGLSALFGVTALAIATANADMPWTVAGGNQLSIGGKSISTQSGWSFNALQQAVLAAVPEYTFAQTIDDIAGVAGALQDGGLLACPAARPAVPASGTTVAAVATSCHVDPLALAQANAGTQGIMASGVTLTFAPSAGAPVTVTTGTKDTFNSILCRFAAAGASPSLADVLAANPTAALIGAGAALLLPVPPSAMTATLPVNAGPFTAPVFPLQVWLRIARPVAAIAPGVDATGPVARVDAPVPAPTSPKSSGGATSLTFDAFAEAFVTALPNLRLATGRVEGTSADLWVVDFGASGVASVTVQPVPPVPPAGQGTAAPIAYALRPLYNALQTRTATLVQDVKSDGTLNAPRPIDVQNVDPEAWAIRFLADLDLFVSGPNAGALYADTAGRAALHAALVAKKTLAAAVSRGLWPVLNSGTAVATAALVQAQGTMQEQLSVSLSHAYASAAAVQYEATVSSAYVGSPSLAPAKLDGAPQSVAPAHVGAVPFTLAGAKTALAEASSFVSFVMNVPHPEATRHVLVNLSYVVDEIEFDIAAVPGVSGYTASNWLSFMPSLGSNPPGALHTVLGGADIPIPLRAYPPAPAIRAQSARATATTPDLQTARQWTYGLTYVHQHAAQDEVRVGIETNVVPPLLLGHERFGDTADVVRALAAYMVAADPLWALLAGWADPSRGVPAATLSNAALSFASLAAAVAAGWDARWPLQQSETATPSDAVLDDAALPFRYVVRVNYTPDDGLDTLVLTVEAGGQGPGGAWPTVTYTPPDGTPLDVPFFSATATSATYCFPRQATPPDTPYPAGSAQCLGFAWAGLDVTQIQNARGHLSVRRNQHLLDDGTETNLDFVLRTPDVTAAEIVWPWLSWDDRIVIGRGPASGFAAVLGTAIEALLGTPAGQPISLVGGYGYELVTPSADDAEGVVAYLPAKLRATAVYEATVASDLAGEMVSWFETRNPSEVGSEWIVGVTLYSTVDAAAGSRGRPLLDVRRLVYRLELP